MLTDEQCNEFRRLPMSFNDMVRAIYEAGRASKAAEYADVPPEKFKGLYRAIQPVADYAGAYGSIEARGDRMQAVMDALYSIDNGAYNPKIGGEE